MELWYGTRARVEGPKSMLWRLVDHFVDNLHIARLADSRGDRESALSGKEAEPLMMRRASQSGVAQEEDDHNRHHHIDYHLR